MNEKDKPEMKKSFPNDDLLKEQREMEGKLLAEDREAGIVIWPEETNEGNLVFISIENVTINLEEANFYALTKQVQIAAKKLLNLD
jgi:uncharacterized protein (AIM24 family)